MDVYSYPQGDPLLIDKIVNEFLSQGKFDKLRKECMSDADTKPAYQNLQKRVENTVKQFLKKKVWKPDLNKNQLRDSLRKHILESKFFDAGINRIVDQVVNPNVLATVFLPEVEEVVYNYLSIPRPSEKLQKNGSYDEGSKIRSSPRKDDYMASQNKYDRERSNGKDYKKENEAKNKMDTDGIKQEAADVKIKMETDEDTVGFTPTEKLEFVTDDSQESLSRMTDEGLHINESDAAPPPDSDDSIPLEVNEKSMSESRDSEDSIMNQMSPISQGRLTPDLEELPEVKEEVKEAEKPEEKNPLTFIGRIPKIKREDTDSSKSSKSKDDTPKREGKNIYSSDESDSSKSNGRSDKKEERKREEEKREKERKERERDRTREREHRRERSRERHKKSSSSSSSGRNSSHHKSSHRHKDSKSRRKEEEKKKNKSTDDHSKERNKKEDRRSTDRDSNERERGRSSGNRGENESRKKEKEQTKTEESRNEKNHKEEAVEGEKAPTVKEEGEDKTPIVKEVEKEKAQTVKEIVEGDKTFKMKDVEVERKPTVKEIVEGEKKTTVKGVVEGEKTLKMKEVEIEKKSTVKEIVEGEKTLQMKDVEVERKPTVKGVVEGEKTLKMKDVELEKKATEKEVEKAQKRKAEGEGEKSRKRKETEIEKPSPVSADIVEADKMTPGLETLNFGDLFRSGAISRHHFPKLTDDFYVKFNSTGFRYFEEWEKTKLDCEEEFKEFVDEAEKDVSLLSTDEDTTEEEEEEENARTIRDLLRGVGNFRRSLMFDPLTAEFYSWTSVKSWAKHREGGEGKKTERMAEAMKENIERGEKRRAMHLKLLKKYKRKAMRMGKPRRRQRKGEVRGGIKEKNENLKEYNGVVMVGEEGLFAGGGVGVGGNVGGGGGREGVQTPESLEENEEWRRGREEGAATKIAGSLPLNLPPSPDSDDVNTNSGLRIVGVNEGMESRKRGEKGERGGMERERESGNPKRAKRSHSSQKYESQDLYKPRPILNGSRTRGRERGFDSPISR